jgi:hypothetical protein
MTAKDARQWLDDLPAVWKIMLTVFAIIASGAGGAVTALRTADLFGSIPSRVERLEREGTAQGRENRLRIELLEQHVHDLGPAVRYLTCVSREERQNNDGKACDYFIRDVLQDYRPDRR